MFRAAARVRSEGQGLVEYALIILLMAVALVTALGLFKDGIQSGIQSAVTALS
jgi:Flp pilus assembly pilin Flp